jgi:hypothetical protein
VFKLTKEKTLRTRSHGGRSEELLSGGKSPFDSKIFAISKRWSINSPHYLISSRQKIDRAKFESPPQLGATLVRIYSEHKTIRAGEIPQEQARTKDSPRLRERPIFFEGFSSRNVDDLSPHT